MPCMNMLDTCLLRHWHFAWTDAFGPGMDSRLRSDAREKQREGREVRELEEELQALRAKHQELSVNSGFRVHGLDNFWEDHFSGQNSGALKVW